MKRIINKKLLLSALAILGILATNSVFAIEEKTDIDTQKQNGEINKNILTPNVSPGILGDTEKSRMYYESVEDAHRTELNVLQGQLDMLQIDEVKLPERLNKTAPEQEVKKVEFSKSDIFSEFEIMKFRSLLENKKASAEDLNNFVGVINEQYHKKKVYTARASLESFQDGILKIELMEAKVGKVYVEGNKFNRKWFLKKMVGPKAGKTLNLQELEQDLQRFNNNARSIKLYAELKPGDEYGTTDVILKAEEKFPYHLSATWDSFGRETTGLMRGGIMLSTDSLVGFQDRLTGAINIASGSTNPWVDYNVPINKYGTRLGGSYMYGRSKIISGDYGDFDLGAGTHVFSTYITHPLITKERFNLNFNTSANIKLSTADIQGYEYSKYKDYNLAVGVGGRYNFNKSFLYGSLYSTNGLINDSMGDATNYFTKFNADAYYVHYLPKGIIATVRAGGQYSPQDIAYVEQYQIGGISTVRGYSESLLLGASSYFASLEALFPIPFLPEEINVPFTKGKHQYRLRDSFKLAAFYDTGAIFPNDNTPVSDTNFLMSTGAGLRMAISKYLTARFYIGIPLMNISYYGQPSCRLHFDVIATPF